jgi:multidrug efflux system outer membrane protein
MDGRRAELTFLLTALIASLGAGACTVGPDYEPPDVEDITPASWRWKPAEPREAADKGEWWRLLGDPALDTLVAQALEHNQDLRSAVARVDAARASARIAKSEFFPSLSIGALYRREATSGNLPTPIPVSVPAGHLSTYSIPLDLRYEVDLWGRVRRSFEAAGARAEATVADYRNVLLTLTADVAASYLQIRSLDGEIALLERAIELRADEVRIASARFEAGSVPEIDLAQAELELASARALLADAQRWRERAFDALALLCGQPPGSFQLPEGSAGAEPLVVPAGLPSALLERRPDVAAAERRLAAANARIGVAEAAYFPALSLTGQAGFLSDEADELFSADSRVWSITPSVSLPLFTGGRTAAEVEQAEAAHEDALAQYRQSVLVAFREVEDALTDVALLAVEAEATSEALASARRVTELAQARYEAGHSPYLEFVEAERAQLDRERALIQLGYLRHAASIGLIKALGGAWDPPQVEH